MTGVMVVFSGENPWFHSSSAKSSDLNINPVGKGKGPKKTQTKTRASAKSGPEVVNPIFLAMASISMDPFWRTTFNDAAINKFHRGFRYENDILIHKVRNKITTCSLSGLSPEYAIEIVQTFMRTTSGIMSSIDIESRNRQLKQIMAMTSEQSIDSWGKVRSLQHRAILIANYVAMVAEQLGLSEHEEERLDSIIRLGVMTKYFNSSTIHMANSVIIHIDGLCRGIDGSFVIDYSRQPEKSKTTTRKGVHDTVTPHPEHDDEHDEEIDPQVSVNALKKWQKLIDHLGKKGDVCVHHRHEIESCSLDS